MWGAAAVKMGRPLLAKLEVRRRAEVAAALREVGDPIWGMGCPHIGRSTDVERRTSRPSSHHALHPRPGALATMEEWPPGDRSLMNRSRSHLRARGIAALPAIAPLMTLLLAPAMPVSAVSTDTFIDFGSHKHVFNQSTEDEPSVAIDPAHPNILAAGVNDNPDGEACNAGDPTTCPYTDGVGGAGISFSTDGGGTWTAPTYTGYSARSCLGPAEFNATSIYGGWYTP